MIAPRYFVGSKKFVHSNEPDAFIFLCIRLHGIQHSKIYQLKKYVQHALYKQRMRSVDANK